MTTQLPRDLHVTLAEPVTTVVRPDAGGFVFEIDGVEKGRAPEWQPLWARAMDLLDCVGGRAKRFEFCDGREVLAHHRFRYIAPELRKAGHDG